MVSKKITQPASEKISDAELYTLVKAANVIVIVEEKIHFFSEEGIWPVVSERAAVLSFRRLFADPVIISRRGKHRIALWKAPFRFTESSRAQRGKH